MIQNKNQVPSDCIIEYYFSQDQVRFRFEPEDCVIFVSVKS